MQFILSTLVTALPAILPVFVLMCTRIRPMRFRAQRNLLLLAIAAYAGAIGAFAAHAAGLAGGVAEFYAAFYGTPARMTGWCMAGYAGQGLAVFALMLIVNWTTILGNLGRGPKAEAAAAEAARAKAERARDAGAK